ncbi:hypothetical protein [Actinomadura sp. HBU206391]|uniref:hypothetical protein n=1 Tax=Actinomadura sp. HBU206391 TaxID=2731692 RepID=UPI001650C4A1|nr:hypothetical protein [Actinomadura sp. HBU206391]MBC6460686.1 hypothetical protein [Actinomadura sp. HBU206391]
MSEGDREVLVTMRTAVDAQAKQGLGEVHSPGRRVPRKNARAWANAATGSDLEAQIDLDFILGAVVPAI